MASIVQPGKDYGPEIDTTPASRPNKSVSLEGTYVTLSPWSQKYYPSIWKHWSKDPMLLAYTEAHVINSEDVLRTEFKDLEGSEEPICYAVLADPEHLNPRPGEDGKPLHTEALGVVFYGDIKPENRAIEIGALLSTTMQRSAASTEIHYLLLKHVMDADSPILENGSPPYRRAAWKCNSLNEASKKAAERVGYVLEGTHRQAQIQNGRSRDDNVYSMLDTEWLANRAALEKWLRMENWGDDGRQLMKLEQIRAEIKMGAM